MELSRKYPSPMPAFTYLDGDIIDTLIAYITSIDAVEKNDQLKLIDPALFIKNPIRDTIRTSDLVLDVLHLLTVPESSSNSPKARINMIREDGSGSNRFYINDLHGKLYRIENRALTMYLDLAAEMPNFVDKPGLGTGFGSIAFHPDYNQNHLFYTTHTEKPGSGKSTFPYADTIPVVVEWVLTEWKVDNPFLSEFSGSHRPLLRIYMPSGIHGVQDINFNTALPKSYPDRNLVYIGVGDGGSTLEGYPNLCCRPISAFGAILRIDPLGSNSQNNQYGIPQDNPLAKSTRTDVIKELCDELEGFFEAYQMDRCWSKDNSKVTVCFTAEKIKNKWLPN